MKMFALNDEIAELEKTLALLQNAARLAVLPALAWYMCQRDTQRALALASEAQTLLTSSELPRREQQRINARLQLVFGEAKWLFAQLDEADALIQDALQEFTKIDDTDGIADAHWLLASSAADHGDTERRINQLEAAKTSAERANDATRIGVMQASMANWAVVTDLDAAQARWSGYFNDTTLGDMHPALANFVCDYLALIAFRSSDFGRAAGYFMRCHELALQVGQVRRAILAAANVGYSFTRLNDHHAALEWKQRALELARPTGWPASIGACLMQTGETLRMLRQLEAAQDLLDEALKTLEPLSGSRNYAITLNSLGDLALDQSHYAIALDIFRHLEERSGVLCQVEFQIDGGRGQAHALSHLGQPIPALEIAAKALNLAQQNHDPYRQIAVLRVLADIHSSHPLPLPANIRADSAALHYLRQALDVAAGIDGFAAPGELLDAIGREFANVGDYAHAYTISLQAIAAREKIHSQEATNRAISMQVRHHTERAQAEGDHHRQLASAEAARARALQKTTETLEHLSAIGQEITAHLDASAVFHALNRHVQGLLDADSFAIYLTEPDGLALVRAFGTEGGKALPIGHVDLANPIADSVRCMRERREIVIDRQNDTEPADIVPGTLSPASALFLPLIIGQRILGVMTVQSIKPHAYGGTELLIFRTLCAYGAIALDNASAYRQLQGAQAQLVSQEKLAALGSLVAGVAHELNTPIGNSLLTASTVLERLNELAEKLRGQNLRRSDLTEFVNGAKEASVLIMRGLNHAADLVNSFKQVAVDRTTAQRRQFKLHQACHEIVATIMNQIRTAGHRIHLDIPENIELESYPGPLGQVITNLINNALIHAFEGIKKGEMTLGANINEVGRVQIQFSDNGNGISSENLKRIFDPFFTTKMGRGGSGLGLSISHNIVTSLLNGKITATSNLSDGTTFTLNLPLTAPPPQR